MTDKQIKALLEKAKMTARDIALTNADKYFMVDANLYNQVIASLDEYQSQEPADHIPDAGQKVDGFVKEIREYFADFIYAENNNVPMQHKPRCLEHDLIEACNRLEEAEKWKDIAYNQAAHIKQLQAKLEAQTKELKK